MGGDGRGGEGEQRGDGAESSTSTASGAKEAAEAPAAGWLGANREGRRGRGVIVLGRGEGVREAEGAGGGLSEHMVSAHVTLPGAGEESMKCNNAKRGSELRLPQLLAVGTQMCLNTVSSVRQQGRHGMEVLQILFFT